MLLIPFESIIETFPGPVWVQDTAGHILWHNDTWKRYTGAGLRMAGSQRDTSMPDDDYTGYFHSNDRDKLLLAVIQAMRVGGWAELHARIRDRRARYQWFYLKLGYYTDPEDGSGRWMGLAVDSQDAWHRSEGEHEKRLEVALEAGGMAVWDWNVITGEMIWEDRHFLLMGTHDRPEGVTVDYFLRFVHEADRAIVKAKMDEAIMSLGIFHAEFRMVRTDNQERWVCGYGCVTGRLNPRGLNMVGILSDITDRKLHEMRKDRFIGIASHELRTPVTSIKAYGQLLQRQLSRETEEGQIVDRLVYQADYLTQLVRQLLDTTRISEQQLVLDYGWFGWDEQLTQSIEALAAGAPEKPIHFENGHAGEVWADKERIRQVCTNLLSNAIKFSPTGSPIIVRTWRNGDMVGFSVRDHGAGIPKPMLDKIFEPFVQVHEQTVSTQPGHAGLGLGLYISAGIVRRHGGEIGVESKPDEGSLFYFTIPAGGTGMDREKG
jgi:two-component system, chemotaxis family, CheB/CheR fusion protein